MRVRGSNPYGIDQKIDCFHVSRSGSLCRGGFEPSGGSNIVEGAPVSWRLRAGIIEVLRHGRVR